MDATRWIPASVPAMVLNGALVIVVVAAVAAAVGVALVVWAIIGDD